MHSHKSAISLEAVDGPKPPLEVEEEPQPPSDDAPALAKHPSLVDWAQDPQNPLLWSSRRKGVNCAVTTLNGAACTIAASIVVPANRQVGLSYGEPNLEIVLLVTTAYLLGQGAGPFVFGATSYTRFADRSGPLSELYGRRTAFIASMAGFVVFSIACAVAPNLAALSACRRPDRLKLAVALRFFAGAFGSSGPTIGAATM